MTGSHPRRRDATQAASGTILASKHRVPAGLPGLSVPARAYQEAVSLGDVRSIKMLPPALMATVNNAGALRRLGALYPAAW